MNFGLLISALSCFAAGGFAGGLSCARAPETISALIAADIINVLTILGLPTGVEVKERRFSLYGEQRAKDAHVPQTIDSMKLVIPGRGEAASPESITPVCGYGFRALGPSGLAPE